MLSLQDRLRPNVEEVAAKVMDGEAIIINLSNGTYYSTDGVGGLVWELVEHGYAMKGIASILCARYDSDRQRVEDDVIALGEQLLEENLVSVSSEGERDVETALEGAQSKTEYKSPVLHIYRDMADLLALDPPMPGLHEPTWEDEG